MNTTVFEMEVKMTKILKCPDCGSFVTYDPQLQKMKCEYCGKVMDTQESQDEFDVADGETVEGSFDEAEKEQVKLKVYKCPSCGAEILTDEFTSSTHCSFCGNPTMMEDRFEGEHKPAYIIPFVIDKGKAIEMYKAWAKKGVFTPKFFSEEATIEKITGMYVPFWLYDYNSREMVKADCTRVRRKVKGDYEYVYTDHYMVGRDLECDYLKIPADASEKMPDDVMDMLEPFDYSKLCDFEMPYLSGFYSEKYNYTGDQMSPRVEYRVKKYINDAVMQTITGYATVNVMGRNVNIKKLQAKYALLPVWILNCKYKDKDFFFAMNGQTGRIVARKPLSKKKMMTWGAGLWVALFALLKFLGGWI